jgi:hypothetical protein
MGIDIDPDEVSAAGRKLQELTEAARRRIAGRLTSTESAVSAHSGWRCSVALDTCRAAFQAQLDRLIGQTSTAAENLLTTAVNVSSSDQEAVDRFRAVLVVLGNS